MVDESGRFLWHYVDAPSKVVTDETVLKADLTKHPNCEPFLARLSLENSAYKFALCATMKTRELWLMQKAFAAAAGQPEPYPQTTREELIQSLARDYEFYGVASGLEHTKQLVRDFEAEAARQAKAKGR